MAGWRKMLNPLHVRRPHDCIRIQRPGGYEASKSKGHGRLNKQLVQSRLPVRPIGAQETHIPALFDSFRIIELRVGRTIQSRCASRAILPSNPAKHWTAGKGQIQREFRNYIGAEIFVIPALQLTKSNWSIDIVECSNTMSCVRHPLAHRDPFRNIRSYDYRACITDKGGEPVPQFLEAFI